MRLDDALTTNALLSEIFPPKIGGTGRWYWELYRRLPRQSVVVLAGEDARQTSFDRDHDLRITRLPLTFPTWLLRPRTFGPYRRAAATLLGVVQREQVGLIHCGKVLPEGILARYAACRAGIGYACWAHGEEINLSNSRTHPPWYRRRVFASRELAQMVGLVLRGARFVIANCRHTRRILIERWGIAEQRVRLLYPGVDTETFHPAPREPATRERLGWSDRTVVLTTGRLQRRKGHDVLIRALPEIRRAIPDLLYAVAGDGEERQRLQRLTREAGVEAHVLFMGAVDDPTLVECYQQCDLFVLPNREIEGDIEGFGMVLLEAQACGRPVVAGSSGGTSEAMIPGASGWLTSCVEPAELAQTLIPVLRDRRTREQRGRRGRRWVLEKFDWEVVSRDAAGIFGIEPAAPGYVPDA